MARGVQDKPNGLRLPAAKDAAKLMQEGALAMERGQWERAEKRLMAAREQLRQLDPVSWPALQAGHMVLQLRLALAQWDKAAGVIREQLGLAERLQASRALVTALRDLSQILSAGNGGEELEQALAMLSDLVSINLDQDPTTNHGFPKNRIQGSSGR
jgi:hypothetical protein